MAITAGTAFDDADGGVGVGLGMPATLPAAPFHVKALASPQHPRHCVMACSRDTPNMRDHGRRTMRIQPQIIQNHGLATSCAVFFDPYQQKWYNTARELEVDDPVGIHHQQPPTVER
jgi:hypothetical protein